MPARNIARLGYVLLGLLQQPLSGYDLRKLFADTPLKVYSDSPGAIYPALRRLEREALVRGEVEKRSGRRRRLYRVTAAGAGELKAWLAQPVTRDDVERRLDDLLLRFSFMDEVLGPGHAGRFLRQLESELDAHVRGLHAYYQATHRSMPRSGRLALQSGIMSYESLLRWSRRAIMAYKKG